VNHLISYSKRGPYDEIATPPEAVDLVVPYLHELDAPDHTWPILWESAPPRRGNSKSKLARRLREHGFVTLVEQSPRWDFFKWQTGGYDVQVTNPPYSLKYKWIERTMELGKPAALLLPITVIGAKAAHSFVTQCRVILLPHRIDFVGKRRPWFSVCWMLWRFPGRPGLELGY